MKFIYLKICQNCTIKPTTSVYRQSIIPSQIIFQINYLFLFILLFIIFIGSNGWEENGFFYFYNLITNFIPFSIDSEGNTIKDEVLRLRGQMVFVKELDSLVYLSTPV